MTQMKRGDLDIELTDEAVDVKLNASARAKLAGFIFIICGIVVMDVVLLLAPGRYQSMWHNIAGREEPI